MSADPAVPIKRRGRPLASTGSPKTAYITFRTTQARRVALQRLAEAAGLSMAAWIERCIDEAT